MMLMNGCFFHCIMILLRFNVKFGDNEKKRDNSNGDD